MNISTLISRRKSQKASRPSSGGSNLQFTWLNFVQGINQQGSDGNYLIAPATPANLVVLATTNQVQLNWDASPSTTVYHVKRSLVLGGPYTVINSPATNSFTDTTAVDGTTYYYVVSAQNSGGESANSNEVTATPPGDPYFNRLVYHQTGAGTTTVINPTGAFDLSGLVPEVDEIHCHTAAAITSLTVITGTDLTVVDLVALPALATLKLTGCPLLASLDLSGFTSFTDLWLSNCALTVLDINDVTSVTNSLLLNGTSLVVISLPNLASVTTISVANSNSLTTFAVAGLVTATSIDASGSPLLSGLNFTSLTLFGSLNVSNTDVVSINLPANIDEIGAINASNCASLTTLGAGGVPVLTQGFTYNFLNCSLDEASVDSVMQWGIDGLVTTCTIDTSGGLSSYPSATGITNANNLIADGNTVSFNAPATYPPDDDFESYADGVDLGGLNGGTAWNGAYTSRAAPAPANDDFESYTNGANLDTLNGGTNWNAAYVSR